MLRRKLSKPLRALADACEADYLIVIRCEECGSKKQMHPYRLISQNKDLAKAPLGKPVPGFLCKSCRRRTRVVISCTLMHPGEF